MREHSICLPRAFKAESLSVSPLGFAALCGHAPAVKLLLDHGASIDRVMGSFGETACHVAVRLRRDDVVDVLIASGANLAVKNEEGLTALCIASYCYDERSAIALISAGAPLDCPAPLCHAATISTRVITLLLERGVKVGALRDNNGESPCHVAVHRRETDTLVIDMLLNVAGVDVNATNNNQVSCLLLAAALGKPTALRAFIAHGASLDQVDQRGWSPLYASVNAWDGACVRLLLAAGADVHVQTNDGETACHKAASTGMWMSMHNLLAAGADFDALNNTGQTARQLAAEESAGAPTAADIDDAHRRIASARLDYVRQRALHVCVGLQPLRLDALQLCELLVHSCGPVAPLVPFHHWWRIATTVKHFKSGASTVQTSGAKIFQPH